MNSAAAAATTTTTTTTTTSTSTATIATNNDKIIVQNKGCYHLLNNIMRSKFNGNIKNNNSGCQMRRFNKATIRV